MALTAAPQGPCDRRTKCPLLLSRTARVREVGAPSFQFVPDVQHPDDERAVGLVDEDEPALAQELAHELPVLVIVSVAGSGLALDAISADGESDRDMLPAAPQELGLP